jgi:hypothetical protein
MIFRRPAEEGQGPPQSPPRLLLPAGVVPTWLAGQTQVQVAGESFHAPAITTAAGEAGPTGPLIAVLIPESDNPYDDHAVAVYLNSYLVGHMPREMAAQAHPALLAYAATHGGGPVSCPAQVHYHDVGPEVVLFLDASALAVSTSVLDHVPELADAIQRLLPRLDEPAPTLSGADTQAKGELARAEQARDEVDADYHHGPDAWPQVEQQFRLVAARLENANDPLASKAWLGVAQSVRYQRNRRDDFLDAVIEALHWDWRNTDAWLALADYASAAPHVPTLLAIFTRIPATARPPVLKRMITMSRGHDRLGRMSSEDGERLRDELLALAKSEGDTTTAATLSKRPGSAARLKAQQSEHKGNG